MRAELVANVTDVAARIVNRSAQTYGQTSPACWRAARPDAHIWAKQSGLSAELSVLLRLGPARNTLKP